MPVRKPHSVPVFYTANEPLQLPLLSLLQMLHQTVPSISVTATEELTKASFPSSTPVFRVANTFSHGITPQPCDMKAKGVAFTPEGPRDNEHSEHSPTPTESSLFSLESELADSGKIPKPGGEAGRPGWGGYNLEEQVGWGETKFKQLKRLAHKLIKKYLDATQSRSAQELSGIKTVKRQMLKAYPMLDTFENCWPVDDLIMLQLKYMSQRSRQVARAKSTTPTPPKKSK